MDIVTIEGANCNLAESQDEYITLPTRISYITVAVGENEVEDMPCFQSAWKPSPEELELINNGAPIVLTILGTAHPPVMLTVE